MQVTIKSVQGYLSLGHPQAPTGPQASGAINYRIAGVPAGTKLHQVLIQLERVTVLPPAGTGSVLLDAYDWTIPWPLIAGRPAGSIVRLPAPAGLDSDRDPPIMAFERRPRP